MSFRAEFWRERPSNRHSSQNSALRIVFQVLAFSEARASYLILFKVKFRWKVSVIWTISGNLALKDVSEALVSVGDRSCNLMSFRAELKRNRLSLGRSSQNSALRIDLAWYGFRKGQSFVGTFSRDWIPLRPPRIRAVFEETGPEVGFRSSVLSWGQSLWFSFITKFLLDRS